MTNASVKTAWKGPTIRQIASVAGVGPATVDRVLNNRSAVREKTRQRVMDAYQKLSQEGQSRDLLNIRLFCESGETFNSALAQAITVANRTIPGVEVTGHFVNTDRLDPIAFSRRITDDGGPSDGVLLIAREHPSINRAARRLRAEGVPVVCLTSDLPSSRRNAYIGNDQYAAGGVAAQLIGLACHAPNARILLVVRESFRTQQEREMGFRRVLRSDFPHLRIEERVISDDHAETTYAQLAKHFTDNGPPDAIYNLAGGNRGVARALKGLDTAHPDGRRATIFVGHELTPTSRELLEAGIMNYVISHDFDGELAQAVNYIRASQDGPPPAPASSQILVHTRHNCDLQ